MSLIDINKQMPEIGKEVLVLVDGHRGPSWSNSYFLVAYLYNDGEFYPCESPYSAKEPVIGVIAWSELPEKIF